VKSLILRIYGLGLPIVYWGISVCLKEGPIPALENFDYCVILRLQPPLPGICSVFRGHGEALATDGNAIQFDTRSRSVCRERMLSNRNGLFKGWKLDYAKSDVRERGNCQLRGLYFPLLLKKGIFGWVLRLGKNIIRCPRLDSGRVICHAGDIYPVSVCANRRPMECQSDLKVRFLWRNGHLVSMRNRSEWDFVVRRFSKAVNGLRKECTLRPFAVTWPVAGFRDVTVLFEKLLSGHSLLIVTVEEFWRRQYFRCTFE
jgi:hypothetical protein